MINIKDLWEKGKDDFAKKQAEQERKLNRIINVTLDEMKMEQPIKNFTKTNIEIDGIAKITKAVYIVTGLVLGNIFAAFVVYSVKTLIFK